MALPNTQKVIIDKNQAVKPDWYNAVLIGHVEKAGQSAVSSHIEFELKGAGKRVWAVLPHDMDSLGLIKKLKQALGMRDEDTDLSLYYNKALRIYIDNIFKDGRISNEIKDFDRYQERRPQDTQRESGQGRGEVQIEVLGKKVPKNIMICDDQPEVAMLIANYIDQIGFVPEIVSTVDDAIGAFDPEKYLLVISDVIMPGKNGFDLVRSLHNKYRRVPVALISGYFDREMENLQKLFGIERVYRKPVFFKSVKEMVAAAIQKFEPSSTVQS